MPDDTALKDLFNLIGAAGETWISEAIASQLPEHLQLDFKQKERPSQAGATSKDQEEYSKALSGFANSEGGIAIWGVDARKPSGDHTAPDAACGEVPISALRRFRTDMEGLTAQLVSPHVPGVEIKEINKSGVSDTGFLVVLIPEGVNPPYMAQKDHRYYGRSGSSFLRMENYQVRDLLSRRSKPRLTLVVDVVPMGATNGRSQYGFMISLLNEGRGIAHWPALKLWVTGGRIGEWELDGNGNSGLPKAISIDGSRFYKGTVNDVIFPGELRHITKTAYRTVPVRLEPGEIEEFRVKYELHASEMPSASSEITIPANAIHAALWRLQDSTAPVRVSPST